MSNPARAPKENIQHNPYVAPDAYYTMSQEAKEYARKAKQVETIKEMLEGLDMEVVKTFYVPKELTVDPGILESKKECLASAKRGKLSLRLRSKYARSMTTAMFSKLPGEGFGSRSVVGDAMRSKVSADGGSEYTLGRFRKYYPREMSSIKSPPTRAEAERALVNCGAVITHLPSHATRPFPLLSSDHVKGVTVNPKSDNGFPVLGKFGDPVAQHKCIELAVTVRHEIRQAVRTPGGVYAWARKKEEGQPYLITLKGKAKGDYYSAPKLDAALMRFYNALPRQIMLNMQVATQPYEQLKTSIVKDSRTHSGSGVSLVRGGAAKLVSKLDEQLLRDGVGYVHVGDDSWVAMRIGDRLVSFALDCSSFDLTQHHSASEHVHQVVREQLSRIDAPAADLWHALARERNVVVAGTVVRKFKHAGPSGMPLQSMVNDILMEILITRVVDKIRADEAKGLPLLEEDVNEILNNVGVDMGFVIKVEQYRSEAFTTVWDSLLKPFLFIGYYFTRQDDEILPFCDLPRTMAQMPYPSLKWMDNDTGELQVKEAMRLGSILMGVGVPPRAYEQAFEAGRACAVKLLEDAIAKFGDSTDPDLVWAVQSSSQGPILEPSLSGLLRALKRDPRILWLKEDKELKGESVMITDWAEQAEDEETREAEELGIKRPVAMTLPKPRLLVGKLGLHIPTHPATDRNDGRPPPIAEWLPDKPKFIRHVKLGYAGRIGEVLDDEEDETHFYIHSNLTHDELLAREYMERKNFEDGDVDEGSVYMGSEGGSLMSEDEYRRRFETPW